MLKVNISSEIDLIIEVGIEGIVGIKINIKSEIRR